MQYRSVKRVLISKTYPSSPTVIPKRSVPSTAQTAVPLFTRTVTNSANGIPMPIMAKDYASTTSPVLHHAVLLVDLQGSLHIHLLLLMARRFALGLPITIAIKLDGQSVATITEEGTAPNIRQCATTILKMSTDGITASMPLVFLAILAQVNPLVATSLEADR